MHIVRPIHDPDHESDGPFTPIGGAALPHPRNVIQLRRPRPVVLIVASAERVAA